MTATVGEVATEGSRAQYAAVMPAVWPLTGRAEELAAVLTHARGPGVVLAGAAGVGKTRLAREALTLARRNTREWRYVAATTSARSVPLGAFVDYATRLGDDLLARVGEVVDAVTGSVDGQTLVVIDDAHLLDEQSALVAHHIVRRRLATVVLTVRSGEQAPDAITALWKDQLLARLDVQPLSRPETADLLEAVLGGPVESASAGRLWHYTRGNVLYLRQLLADELAAEHIARRSGVWIWDTEPAVSSTLAELIDANIGRQPEQVLDVLDVLAVADPLELDILRTLVSDVAVEEAEAANLITVDTDATPPVARLAHPMYGEVRRQRAPALRLRRLRSAIVAASPSLAGDGIDAVRLVRRAVLLIDSDTAPDPAMLIAAADAAVRLMDPITAERIARHAVENGGGQPARLMLMNALANGDRLDEALTVNTRLLDAASEKTEKVKLGLLRVGIFVRQNNLVAARQIEQLEAPAADAEMSRSYRCVLAAVRAFDEEFQSAVDAAVAGLTGPGPLAEAAEFTGILGLVTACGELGRIDTIREFIDRGYHLARTTPYTPTSRFLLSLRHVVALTLAGLLEEAIEVSRRVEQEPMEFPLALACRAHVNGVAATAAGELAAAQRLLLEAAATAQSVQQQWLRSSIQLDLGIALAIVGRGEQARAVLATVHPEDPIRRSFEFADVAEAWVRAASGLTGEAVAIVRDAARRARTAGAPAREVCCLQVSTQFGDPTDADRLAELTTVVQGPRAAAAAAHAAALRDADGDGLLAAARSYEAFGDRVAAGDAAAQAAVVFRGQGRHGAALTATAFARRLADETGADTPALRANNSPIPLTGRQREIIALAAHGLSNREIAERLTMSVRTVEGHLFRACQRTGLSSRQDLIALLEGR